MLQDGLPSSCLDGLKRGGATAAEPTSFCGAERCRGRRAIFWSFTRCKLIRRTFLNATWQVAGLTVPIRTLETYCLGAADSMCLLSTPLVAECKTNFFISTHALARSVLHLLRRNKVMKFQFYCLFTNRGGVIWIGRLNKLQNKQIEFRSKPYVCV